MSGDTPVVPEYYVDVAAQTPEFKQGFEEGLAKALAIKTLQFSSEERCLKMLNFLFLERKQKGQMSEKLLRMNAGYFLGMLSGGVFTLKEGT